MKYIHHQIKDEIKFHIKKICTYYINEYHG